jgi:hypothetical protein
MAACAIPTSSADHACRGATANHPLTSTPDHLMGAGQLDADAPAEIEKISSRDILVEAGTCIAGDIGPSSCDFCDWRSSVPFARVPLFIGTRPAFP